MPGYYIDSYEEQPCGKYDFKDKQGKPVAVEGRVFKISYCVKRNNKAASEIQILRNHTNAVTKIGGVTLSADDNNTFYNVRKGALDTWAHVNTWNQGDCYTLNIVEKQSMKQEVLADAKQMAQDIKATGKVALYGIYFDTDKATIKPESEPTLKEIAKFLKENASMKVYVVGHADSTGDFGHNQKLSQARAQAVVKELNAKYGIAAARLKGHGVGPLSPVASNSTTEGKAKNRRVELVEQ